MIKIPRMSDRFTLKIEEVEITVKPLNMYHKDEIDACYMMEGGVKQVDAGKQIHLLLKYLVDDVKGIHDYDGKEYVVEKLDGHLTDDCVMELLNTPFSDKLIYSAFQLKNNIPEKFYSFATREEMEGVSIARVDTKRETLDAKKP